MRNRIWCVFAVILVLAATAFVVVRSDEDKATADMLSRAGWFAIPADWKLTTETVRPERFMCISTNPCPSLYRRWDTGKELTENDVTALKSGLSFKMTTDHQCKRPANGSGVITLCSSTGTDSKFDYLLTVTSPGPSEPQLVTLIIRPLYVPVTPPSTGADR